MAEPRILDAVQECSGLMVALKPTHGRHCPCTPCSRQDWAEPGLASCGMHGPGCPPVYAPGPVWIRPPELGISLELAERLIEEQGVKVRGRFE